MKLAIVGLVAAASALMHRRKQRRHTSELLEALQLINRNRLRLRSGHASILPAGSSKRKGAIICKYSSRNQSACRTGLGRHPLFPPRPLLPQGLYGASRLPRGTSYPAIASRSSASSLTKAAGCSQAPAAPEVSLLCRSSLRWHR